MRVRISPDAHRDLHDIRDYIANENPKSAASLLNVLRKGIARLGTFPKIGRQRPDFGDPDTRLMVVRGYCVIYTLIGNEVSVKRVFAPGQQLTPEQ